MPIDPAQLKNYALFKYFWDSPDTPENTGLAHRGLDEINAEGVQKLIDYAKTHNLDGTQSPDGQREITADERDLIQVILSHPHYGAFFEQDARAPLLQAFGIDAGSFHPPTLERRPQDIGDIKLPERASRTSESSLARTDPKRLPEEFAREYTRNRRFFEGPDRRGRPLSDEEKGARVLALLRDYSTALWSHGEQPVTENVGRELLTAYNSAPFAQVHGAKNYNGAPWSVAQGLVLGIDANAFATDFPKAYPDAPTTHLAMNDNMAEPMKHMDAYRVALGMEARAERFERQPVLNWLISEEKGHKKYGSLNEKSPFSTSGINWGIVLFPGDDQIRNLPVKSGFEFPIDCLTRFKSFVTMNPRYGDKMVVQGKDGKPVTVEKVIEEKDGKPVAWSAKFTDAAGKEVKPGDVLGLLQDRAGNVKGDGTSDQSVDMWWWGFCDRNTAQRLYKSKFGIPQIDKLPEGQTGELKPIKIKAGDQTIEVPRSDAQKLIDAHIPDLVTGDTYSGFRFNNETQQIRLQDGSWIQARIKNDLFASKPHVWRLEGDKVVIQDDKDRPLLGSITVTTGPGTTRDVDVKDIKAITQGADGKVTIETTSSYQREVTGEIELELPWDKAEVIDGKKVLKQTKDYLIRGALQILTAEGEKALPIDQIGMIVAETQTDMRPSQYMAWLSANGGMVATDSSLAEVVSNGVRWVHKFDMDQRAGADRPEWAKRAGHELEGVYGPLVRQDDDKIVWVRGLFKNDNKPDTEATSDTFAGWIQTDANGTIINEGFTSGQPDFGWSANGKLNWNFSSSFNEYTQSEMLLALMVNGVPRDKLDDLAKELNFPPNYRRLLVDQD